MGHHQNLKKDEMPLIIYSYSIFQKNQLYLHHFQFPRVALQFEIKSIHSFTIQSIQRNIFFRRNITDQFMLSSMFNSFTNAIFLIILFSIPEWKCRSIANMNISLKPILFLLTFPNRAFQAHNPNVVKLNFPAK